MPKKPLPVRYSNQYTHRFGYLKNRITKEHKAMEGDGDEPMPHEVTLPLTKHFLYKLEVLAKIKNVPVEILAIDAIYKELIGQNFFTFGFKIPWQAKATEKNKEAAHKIHNYLKQFGKKGVRREVLMYSMFDMRIETQQEWLEGYMLLLKACAIEEFDYRDLKKIRTMIKRVRVR